MANSGRVKDYLIETSENGVDWTRITEGRLHNSDELTEIKFPSTVKARYLRFTAKSPHRNGEKWATMAEIQPIWAK